MEKNRCPPDAKRQKYMAPFPNVYVRMKEKEKSIELPRKSKIQKYSSFL